MNKTAAQKHLVIDPALFLPGAVDEDIVLFNENLEILMKEEPAIETVPPEISRRLREQGTPRTGPVVLSPLATERTIPGPGGKLPLRIFLPEEIRGAYLHIHGGGWVLGRAHLQDPYLEAFARAAKCAVISVDYRLAPESPYPAGPEDCEASAAWLLENSKKEFGVDRFCIGGESAGGHLAAAVLLRLKKRFGVAGFHAANFVYGVFDLSGSPSLRRWGDRRLVLNTPGMEWFFDQFVPAGRRRDPDVSPLYADLSGMPPAIFTVGTLDPLLDDSLLMAARWAGAGNTAELEVYPGAVHGFATMNYRPARAANLRIAAFMAEFFTP
jgi:acetyl esterase/lipase